MTRRYKTSYKSHRNVKRFAMTFSPKAIAASVIEVCTICRGKVEESPMLRGVCYTCYQNLVKAPSGFSLADRRAQAEQAAEIANDNEWLTSDLSIPQPRFILTRSWADKHLNSDDDLKYFNGGAVIK